MTVCSRGRVSFYAREDGHNLDREKEYGDLADTFPVFSIHFPHVTIIQLARFSLL